jgi:glycosyltransferase involved in cell wall biosynthesis
MTDKIGKKIAICHYRVGGTDGVSLEIAKRKEILEKYGCEVKLIAGKRSQNADHTIKELEWDDDIIPIIKENGFIHFRRHDLSAEELKRKMNKISSIIEGKLNAIQLQEQFDRVLIHNIFSFGGHVAAAKAFTKWIKKCKIPTLATHHDFYWERKEYQTPRNEYLKRYMQKFMPPKSKYIEHVVINSLAKRELYKRADINARVMPDVFDFEQAKWQVDNFNKDFLHEFAIDPRDLIILQATRVIPRKGIELAIDYAIALQEKISKLKRKKLYNGKKLNSKSKVVLILAGYAEDEKREYLYRLKNKAFENQLCVKFISDHVKAKRKFSHRVKTYSLWDAYAHADVVSFPSIWEGWGNQFIEAIFAKKPIVLYEYPVYKADIKKEGYDIISLGNGGSDLSCDENELYSIPQKNIDKAVKQTIRWLKSSKTSAKLEHNYQIGRKYHDFNVLENFLINQLDLLDNNIK